MSWERPSILLHAHFDCFSGAAGDMMLAACLDAAAKSHGEDKFLQHISACLSKGIPALEGEFELTVKTVWRGKGSIGAKHLQVKSAYNHEAAPVPKPHVAHSHAQTDHDHSHSHTEDATASDHSHSHSHDTDHDHSHSHSEDVAAHEHSHSHSQPHPSTGGPLRNLPEIRQMLLDAPEEYIPIWVRDTGIKVFTKLALAEATVHCAESEDAVHFHEVGAVDSIVDVVGTLLALYFLGVETFSCSRLPMGEGTVYTAHGLLPVPAPATLSLMIGMKVCRGPPGVTGELVTPTAAAILNVLTLSHDGSTVARPPDFTLRTVGIGAGTKDFENHPNILRLMLGEVSDQDRRQPASLTEIL
jgi:uncharacterized protein (DUF111 family)